MASWNRRSSFTVDAENVVGLGPRRERRERHLPGDVPQSLLTAGVERERLGHAVEAGPADMTEQRVDRGGMLVGGPHHDIADAPHRTGVGHPAPQHLLVGSPPQRAITTLGAHRRLSPVALTGIPAIFLGNQGI